MFDGAFEDRSGFPNFGHLYIREPAGVVLVVTWGDDEQEHQVRSTLSGTPEDATADAPDQATFNVVRQDSFRWTLMGNELLGLPSAKHVERHT